MKKLCPWCKLKFIEDFYCPDENCPVVSKGTHSKKCGMFIFWRENIKKEFSYQEIEKLAKLKGFM